jgi:hypothetical protein
VVEHLAFDQSSLSGLMFETLEHWRPVVGYEGFYEVSDRGQVRSLDRVVGHKQLKGRILRPAPNGGGHLAVALCKNGSQSTKKVHSLVAEAFIGPRPDGMEVRHGRNGKLDNSLANLCYGTPKQNGEDKVRDGTSGKGEQCGTARLTVEQVRLARRLVAEGPWGTQARLADQWGVHRKTLSCAVRGVNWGWVD